MLLRPPKVEEQKRMLIRPPLMKQGAAASDRITPTGRFWEDLNLAVAGQIRPEEAPVFPLATPTQRAAKQKSDEWLATREPGQFALNVAKEAISLGPYIIGGAINPAIPAAMMGVQAVQHPIETAKFIGRSAYARMPTAEAAAERTRMLAEGRLGELLAAPGLAIGGLRGATKRMGSVPGAAQAAAREYAGPPGAGFAPISKPTASGGAPAAARFAQGAAGMVDLSRKQLMAPGQERTLSKAEWEAAKARMREKFVPKEPEQPMVVTQGTWPGAAPAMKIRPPKGKPGVAPGTMEYAGELVTLPKPKAVASGELRVARKEGAAKPQGGKEPWEMTREAISEQAKEVHDLAKTKQPLLDEMGMGIAKQLNAEYKGVIKSSESIAAKVIRKNRPGYTVWSPKDHARGSIILKDFASAPDAIQRLKKTGKWEIESTVEAPLNHFGYRGITLNTKLGDDINGEIQIHTPGSWELKQASDQMYRRWRDYEGAGFEKMPVELRKQYARDLNWSKSSWKQLWDQEIPAVRRAITASTAESGMGLESVASPTVPSKMAQEPPGLRTRGILPTAKPAISSKRPSARREYRREGSVDIAPIILSKEQAQVKQNLRNLASPSEAVVAAQKSLGPAEGIKGKTGVAPGTAQAPPGVVENPAGKVQIGVNPLEFSRFMRGEPRSQKSEVRSQPKEIKAETVAKIAKETGDSPGAVTRTINTLDQIKTRLLRWWHDHEYEVRKLQGKAAMKVTEAADPYLRMTLFPKRVRTILDNADPKLQAVFDRLEKEKIDRKLVNDYLWYRHAPERNRVHGEEASGVTSQFALRQQAAIESGAQGKTIVEAANVLQDLDRRTLEMLHDGQVISGELYKRLTEVYKSHVPLNRIIEGMEDEGIAELLWQEGFSALPGGQKKPQGYSVSATGIKRAEASKLPIEDIADNILANFEMAAVRSERNLVDLATLKWMRENKVQLGDLFAEMKPTVIGKDAAGRPILLRTQDPSILQMFEEGQRKWIKINEPSLAIAFRGIGKEVPKGLVYNTIMAFTRLYSGLSTRFTPDFALVNKLRDIPEALVYLAAQEKIGLKGAAKSLVKDPASMKAILEYLQKKDTPGARLYAELQARGGAGGGFGLSTKKYGRISIEKMEALAKSKTKRAAHDLIAYVDMWNRLFEDSTRLTAYKQALEQGLSPDRAAFIAKEASINFDRMGRGGPVVNALWMFSNASIQGSAKMIRALRNPKVLAATVTTVGTAVAAINQWNDRVDEGWRDKVSRWDRLNGLPVMIPRSDGTTGYFTIPVSWGLKPIKVMADYAYDAAAGAVVDYGRMASDLVTSIAEGYNPLGGTDVISALTPTIFDTPIDIARNRSWSGHKIKPDWDPNAPDDIRYFGSLRETATGRAAISISEALQQNIGFVVSPADMTYAYNSYAGGTGRFINKNLNVLAQPLTGKTVPADEYPMLSKFYRERTEEETISGAGGKTAYRKGKLQEQSRERFRIHQRAEDLDAELQKLPAAQANARVAQIKKQEPGLYERLKEVKKYREKGLTGDDRLLMGFGVENGKRAQMIFEDLQGIKSDQERNNYLAQLRKKGIISAEVEKQLVRLRQAQLKGSK